MKLGEGFVLLIFFFETTIYQDCCFTLVFDNEKNHFYTLIIINQLMVQKIWYLPTDNLFIVFPNHILFI